MKKLSLAMLLFIVVVAVLAASNEVVSQLYPSSDADGITLFGNKARNSGYLNITLKSPSACGTYGSTNETCQTATVLDAKVDSKNKYGNPDILYALQNPNNSAKVLSVMSLGVEGTFPDSGDSNAWGYIFDYRNLDTPLVLNFHDKVVQVGTNYLLNTGTINADGGENGHATCWNGRKLGYCASALAADGTCVCK
jgi:hypothetical protein